MKYRTRTFYTDKQKSEIWDRWQRGVSMGSIGRHFNCVVFDLPSFGAVWWDPAT